MRALTCETLRLRLAQVQAGKKEGSVMQLTYYDILPLNLIKLFEYVHDTSFTFLATCFIITGQN